MPSTLSQQSFTSTWTAPPAGGAGVPAPAGGLRLTRRGRLCLLGLSIGLLFAVLCVGRVIGTASASVSAAPQTHTVVVAPGDSAWSLARAAMPHLDGREAVDRLLAMNHSDGHLQVGQTLTVPGR